MKRATAWRLSAGLILLALALALPAIQISRDWAYIDVNTGSRKGHREWLFGWQTRAWYQQSALEKFMRDKLPNEFEQHWVSYAGTGRNLFGTAMLHGHGRPGPILQLSLDVINRHCSQIPDEEKHVLYGLFSSGDAARIQATVERMIMDNHETPKSPGTLEPSGDQPLPVPLPARTDGVSLPSTTPCRCT